MLPLPVLKGRAAPACRGGPIAPSAASASVAAWAAAVPGLAWAEAAPAAPATGLGPWIFGSVALVLVALLGFLAGRRAGAPAPSPTAAPAQAQSDALPAGQSAADTRRSIEALCDEMTGTSRLYRREPGGRGWVLVAAHPALPDGAPPFDGLPAAVAFAACELGADAKADLGGWHLHTSGRGAEERLVLRQAPPAEVPGDDPAAFSFTVTHDLRAPVRVVEGFARILKEDYGRQLDRIGNDHLDRVLASAARMNAMIDAMLSLARLSSQPIARQPVNLSQLAGYVIDDLRRTTPERTVQADIEPGLQAVGDPTLLRQVLENLLSNAWKYTARAEQPRVAFGATEKDGQRVFEVQDNGAGFDMRSADRLFGLFQRLHSANDFPGTGVGLASVQRIVRRHGGAIWAEAEPGHGARFYFTLPG